MGKQSVRITFWSVLVLAFYTPISAKADSAMDLVQITCSKELGYFSLHTFQLQDRNDSPDAEAIKRREDEGLFSAELILQHPYICDTGEAIISVEVTDYRRAREVRNAFGLLIRKNHKKLYQFDAYEGDDACINPTTHFIEMLEPANEYSLKDCLVPNKNGQTTCSYPIKASGSNSKQ